MVKYTKWIEAARDDLIAEVAVRSLQSRLEPVQDYVVLAANKADKDIEYVHVRTLLRRVVRQTMRGETRPQMPFPHCLARRQVR